MQLNQEGRRLIAKNPKPFHTIDEAAEIIYHYIQVPLNENQYAAIMSLVCSMTEYNFGISDVLLFLNAWDLESFEEIYEDYGAYQTLFLRKEELNLFKRFPIVGGKDIEQTA